MSLQVVYDAKMKVGRSGSVKKGSSPQKESGLRGSGATSRRRSNLSRMSSSSPHGKGHSGTTSQRSFRGGFGGGGGAILPGWNKNDYNLMRILANWVYLNVD